MGAAGPCLEFTVVMEQRRKKVVGEHMRPQFGPQRERRRGRCRGLETLQPRPHSGLKRERRRDRDRGCNTQQPGPHFGPGREKE